MRYTLILLVLLLIGIPTVRAQSCDPTLSLTTAPEFADRGRACYNERNNDQVAADLNRAIELDPAYASAYSSRGWLNYRQGQYQAAIADFSYAIQLDPNLADAYWGRGEVYAVQEQLDLALADYKRYLEVTGDSANPNIEDRVRTLESQPPPPGTNRNGLLTALASIVAMVVIYTRFFARRKPKWYPTRRQRTPQYTPERVTDERVTYDSDYR